jgi:hypothetical protein
MPISLVLDPSGAKVCWVGLKGPAAGLSTGWKFAVNGRRLSLAVFTRVDATPGRWQLRADCQTTGGKSSAAVVSVAVGPGAGQGTLATHADMRVVALGNRVDPALGLWSYPDDPDFGFKTPSGTWAPSVYLWVATASGYEEQDATPITHLRWDPPCTKPSGYATHRFARAGAIYKVSVQWIRKDCSTYWEDVTFTATYKVAGKRMTVTFTNGEVWNYVRYKG